MKGELRGTGHADLLSEIERLLDLELSWCERLRQLSERQLEFCVSGHSNRLPGVLQERMRCLERLSELETTLAAVVRRVGDLDLLRSTHGVGKLESKMKRVESLVEKVAALDAKCESALRVELRGVEEGLRELNSQCRTMQSYNSPGDPGGHVVVVTG